MRIRFRLRTLLLSAAALAVPLRWCGRHHALDRQFEDRIAAIERLGGRVMFDAVDESLGIDDRLWRVFGGYDQRGRSASVIFPGDSRLDDDKLGKLDLTSFPCLAGLDLDGCHVGDQSIANFGALSELEELSLAGTGISDRSLKVVAQLTHLEVLDLNGTAVTDAGLRELTTLKRLEVLSVRDTRVTRAAIAELRARCHRRSSTTTQNPETYATA